MSLRLRVLNMRMDETWITIGKYDTIYRLKQLYERANEEKSVAIPVERQRMYYHRKILADERSICDYDLQDESPEPIRVRCMLSKSPTVELKVQYGETIYELESDPKRDDGTVHGLKKMLYKKTRIPDWDQLLFDRFGNLLPNCLYLKMEHKGEVFILKPTSDYTKAQRLKHDDSFRSAHSPCFSPRGTL
mmetsp:Transcript_25306/g.42384  ORF Transcript_25306/g.42384 Transcript_25306/m.42384 type:complete len:190 (+) Transcript_25306:43-612(+)